MEFRDHAGVKLFERVVICILPDCLRWKTHDGEPPACQWNSEIMQKDKSVKEGKGGNMQLGCYCTCVPTLLLLRLISYTTTSYLM